MTARTLEAVLAEHRPRVERSGLIHACTCGRDIAGTHRAHVAAVIREWLLSDETVERAARGMVHLRWPETEPIQNGDRQVARAALAAATGEPSGGDRA